MIRKLIYLLFLIPALAFAGSGNLTWSNVTQDTGVTIVGNKIYRGTKNDGSDLGVIYTSPTPIQSYNDLNLPPSSTFCYAVTVYTSSAESPKSSIVCTTTAPAVLKSPTALVVR